MARSQAEISGRSSRRFPVPPLVVLGIVVGVALVVLALWPREQAEEPSTRAAAVPAPAAIEPGLPRAQRPGDEARAIVARIRSGGEPYDLDAVAARADGLLSAGKLADATLLYFFAAREGHTPSAMALGSMFDPQRFTSTTSLMDAPDPVQALKWYRMAADSGDAEALARLEGLKLWAEERAAEGDEEARRLLLSWR